MLKISGDTLYSLLRHAYKNDLFDDRMQDEVSACFRELRDAKESLRRSDKLEYTIQPTKLGKY